LLRWGGVIKPWLIRVVDDKRLDRHDNSLLCHLFARTESGVKMAVDDLG